MKEEYPKIYIYGSRQNIMITLKGLNSNVFYTVVINKNNIESLEYYVDEMEEQVIRKNNLNNFFIIAKGYNRKYIHQIIQKLLEKGINIIAIKDATPIPHNGCRKPRQKIKY